MLPQTPCSNVLSPSFAYRRVEACPNSLLRHDHPSHLMKAFELKKLRERSALGPESGRGGEVRGPGEGEIKGGARGGGRHWSMYSTLVEMVTLVRLVKMEME